MVNLYSLLLLLFLAKLHGISSVQSLSRVRLFATLWWCHPAISSSVVHFSSCTQTLPASGPIQISQLFISGGQIIGVSASISVLPMHTQDWSSIGWTGWISLQSKDSQESSPTPQFKSIKSSALSFLHSPTLTYIHDHWKKHSFDYMDLCWQSNISAF